MYIRTATSYGDELDKLRVPRINDTRAFAPTQWTSQFNPGLWIKELETKGSILDSRLKPVWESEYLVHLRGAGDVQLGPAVASRCRPVDEAPSAEGEGFEPSVGDHPTAVFKTAALGHYASPPSCRPYATGPLPSDLLSRRRPHTPRKR